VLALIHTRAKLFGLKGDFAELWRGEAAQAAKVSLLHFGKKMDLRV
jgi:hypothetical protein